MPDYHYQPFHLAPLIEILNRCLTQFPGCTVGRSGNDTGNLCVYDYDGEYVGVVQLHDPPELMVFEEEDHA